VHGSAAASKSEANRLSEFLKAILASLHRGEAVSSPAPTPAPVPRPLLLPRRRLRLRRASACRSHAGSAAHRTWHYSPTLRSGLGLDGHLSLPLSVRRWPLRPGW
jgi:hypothetical protein